MLKKILISSDLSEASNALINCTLDLKNIGVEEAVLSHVVVNELITEKTVILDITRDEAAINLLPLLEKQKAVLEDSGIKTTIEVAQHDAPARAVNDLAEKHDVSAIVTGSHGKSIFKRATIGSVSSHLLNITRKPVILFRANLTKPEGAEILACRNLFDHILYLTDFSEIAQKSLDYLEQIVKYSRCKVNVLHTQDFVESSTYIHRAPWLDGKQLAQVEAEHPIAINSDLEAIKQRLLAAGSTEVNFEYRKGKPKETTIDYIKENKQLTLIVMGTQGKGFVKELFVGSLSLHLTRYSPIPILLVPK